MPSKSQITRTEQTYQFELTQEDVVNMMNDPDVLIQDGNVDAEQTFQLILRKDNGTETVLKEMAVLDTLIFRFTTVEILDTTSDFSGVDVET